MPLGLDEALRSADECEIRDGIARFLLDLLRIETVVGPDLAGVRAREEQAFGLITQAAEVILGSGREIERVPIDPRIESDPYYTPTHYTKTAACPAGLSAAETYRGRSNLVVRLPGQGRGTLAFNAHIDIVAPFIPPRLEGGVLYGRGACDDKGQCAAMLAALYFLEHVRWAEGLVPPADLLFEFVIDEEPGGNGSLSLALDRRFALDAMVVLEPTSLAVHPGNRGAVWYRLTLNGAVAPKLDLVGLAAALVLALEEEGARIKAESAHPLFPHRPVQTCHGILGPWGKHPSAVNDHVELGLVFLEDPGLGALRGVVDEAVGAFCAVYGDKTKEPDPTTGKPKVDRHYDLDGQACHYALSVHGKAGHMGAALQCDNAITKAAYILRAIEAADLSVDHFALDPSRRFQTFGRVPGSLTLPKVSNLREGRLVGEPLVLEGGQGFLPTHTLREVTERMRQAIERAAEGYCRDRGVACDPKLAVMTFEKLHNDAFARDPSHPAVRALAGAARAAGIAVAEPLRGWDVSCDARIFAREYPESAVITFGAGSLQHAHSANEQIQLDDLMAAAKTVARFALSFNPKNGTYGTNGTNGTNG
jgi:acetylornithine deacetylase/succinyl-diaminopimelate desuccinylase-like protein